MPEQARPNRGGDLAGYGRGLVERVLSTARVMRPARVVKFDGGLHPKCSAQPLQHRAGEPPDPVVDDVPVMFPGNRHLRFSFKLEDGDTVLLVWSDCSIDDWALMLDTPLALNPVGLEASDARAHHLSDAVALPVATYGLPRLTLTPGGQESALLLWDEICEVLQGATVATMLGPQPLDPATQVKLAALRARLAAIV